MTLANLRAETAQQLVATVRKLSAFQNALFVDAYAQRDTAAVGFPSATWDAAKVHGACGIVGNACSALAMLLGMPAGEAFCLPPNALEPAGGSISTTVPEQAGTPSLEPAAAWDAEEVSQRAEVALMEESLTAALVVIDRSMPKETDPGVGYDNARRRADVLSRLLKLDAVKAAPDTERRLRQALEQARYVGD